MPMLQNKIRCARWSSLSSWVVALAIVLAACADPTATSAPTSVPAETPSTQTQPTQPAPALSTKPTADPPILATPVPIETLRQNIPALGVRQKRIAEALARPVPVLLMSDAAQLDDRQKQAQNLAVQNPQLQSAMRDPVSGAPVRTEILGIYPTRDSDITAATQACKGNTNCYRVELYNYAFNFTVVGIVDVNAKQVLSLVRIADAQPDIPADLTQLATEIAINAPEVQQALGFKPAAKDAVMPNIKTALNQTQCERSRHLCVAPTFLQGQRALWAIVDLTDNKLVGVRWTDLGKSGKPNVVTQKGLQNDFVTTEYCRKENALARAGWKMNFMLTSSDGLRLSNVSFNGQPVLKSAKLVDWHVSYSRKDGFGYSDAVGCPVFSQAAVVAFGGPALQDIQQAGAVVGFSITQDFFSDLWPAPCNYFYQQRYEFYNDGRFRPVAINLGRGCGNDGTYRPVFRLAMAEMGTFAHWDSASNAWKDWPQEQWQSQTDGKPDGKGDQYRIKTNTNGTNGTNGGYTLEPNTGQFGDGSRGDNALIFVTKQHADKDEGESDLITIGPCCNTDFRQGPEKYIDATPENIAASPLVIWYVPQIKNDDTPGKQYCWADSVLEAGVYVAKTYPCATGPMFKPIK